jgi:hypothetical protein
MPVYTHIPKTFISDCLCLHQTLIAKAPIRVALARPTNERCVPMIIHQEHADAHVPKMPVTCAQPSLWIHAHVHKMPCPAARCQWRMRSIVLECVHILASIATWRACNIIRLLQASGSACRRLLRRWGKFTCTDVVMHIHYRDGDEHIHYCIRACLMYICAHLMHLCILAYIVCADA